MLHLLRRITQFAELRPHPARQLLMRVWASERYRTAKCTKNRGSRSTHQGHMLKSGGSALRFTAWLACNVDGTLFPLLECCVRAASWHCMRSHFQELQSKLLPCLTVKESAESGCLCLPFTGSNCVPVGQRRHQLFKDCAVVQTSSRFD